MPFLYLIPRYDVLLVHTCNTQVKAQNNLIMMHIQFFIQRILLKKYSLCRNNATKEFKGLNILFCLQLPFNICDNSDSIYTSDKHQAHQRHPSEGYINNLYIRILQFQT